MRSISGHRSLSERAGCTAGGCPLCIFVRSCTAQLRRLALTSRCAVDARDTAIDPTTQTVYTANSNDTMSVIEAARRS